MNSIDAVAAKARRLLGAGYVTLHAVTPARVVAHVIGDHDRYVVAWTPVLGWGCSCPDLRRRCSHLAAVRLVTCPPTDPAIAHQEELHAVA